MKLLKVTTLLLSSLTLVTFVGCGTSDDDEPTTGSLTPIKNLTDAKEAYVAVDLTPATDIASPLGALALSAELLHNDLRTVLTTQSTLGLCKYGGSARSRDEASNVMTLLYDNCKKSANITLNGGATISPLSGTNVTVAYNGFRIKKATQSALFNTTVNYSNWDNFSSADGSLYAKLNGSASTTYAPEDEEEDEDNNETVTTIYPYMSYTYNNYQASITMSNQAITKLDINGVVAVNYVKDGESCAGGTYSVITEKSMTPSGDALSQGAISINKVDYKFSNTDVTITLYDEDNNISQSELQITCD
jgi:hypothetical protein